jgi:hypothetical protein
MKKPNYLLYFVVSLLGISICVSMLQKFELDSVKGKAIDKEYAEVIDGKFHWKSDIL